MKDCVLLIVVLFLVDSALASFTPGTMASNNQVLRLRDIAMRKNVNSEGLMRRKLRHTFNRKLREGNDDHQKVSGGVDADTVGMKVYKRWRALQDTISDMREELILSNEPVCKFPVVDLSKQKLSSQEFNAKYLKSRTPIVVLNAVKPRNWQWLARQKCLGEISCVNDNEFFERFYKKRIDPQHNIQENGGGYNASKYIQYIIAKHKSHKQGGGGRGGGDDEDAADSYFRDLRYFVGCPRLLQLLALPEFLRDNWSHALQLPCTRILDLPALMLGERETGSGLHLDSMHAEAFSAQLEGTKGWIMGDYGDLVAAKFATLCVHMQAPGTLVYIPRKWAHATYNPGPTISAQGDWFNRHSVGEMEIGREMRDEFPACAEFFTKQRAADGAALTLAERCERSSACEGHVGRSGRSGRSRRSGRIGGGGGGGSGGGRRPVQAGLIHPKICAKFKNTPLWQQAKRSLGAEGWSALLADLNCRPEARYKAISPQREERMLEDFTPELDRRGRSEGGGRDDR